MGADLVAMETGWFARSNTSDLHADPPFLLDRLVRVGVGADGDHPWLVAGFRQLALQEPGCIRLGEQPRLEIEPGREAI